MTRQIKPGYRVREDGRLMEAICTVRDRGVIEFGRRQYRAHRSLQGELVTVRPVGGAGEAVEAIFRNGERLVCPRIAAPSEAPTGKRVTRLKSSPLAKK
jgi:hypothetical protein